MNTPLKNDSLSRSSFGDIYFFDLSDGTLNPISDISKSDANRVSDVIDGETLDVISRELNLFPDSPFTVLLRDGSYAAVMGVFFGASRLMLIGLPNESTELCEILDAFERLSNIHSSRQNDFVSSIRTAAELISGFCAFRTSFRAQNKISCYAAKHPEEQFHDPALISCILLCSFFFASSRSEIFNAVISFNEKNDNPLACISFNLKDRSFRAADAAKTSELSFLTDIFEANQIAYSFLCKDGTLKISFSLLCKDWSLYGIKHEELDLFDNEDDSDAHPLA